MLPQLSMPFNGLVCFSSAARVGRQDAGSVSNTPVWWKLTWSMPSTEETMGKKHTPDWAVKLLKHTFETSYLIVSSSCCCVYEGGGLPTTASCTAWLLRRASGTAWARRDPPGPSWTWMKSRYSKYFWPQLHWEKVNVGLKNYFETGETQGLQNVAKTKKGSKLSSSLLWRPVARQPAWKLRPLLWLFCLHLTQTDYVRQRQNFKPSRWRSWGLPATSIHPSILTSPPCIPHLFALPPSLLLPPSACPHLCQEPDQSRAAHS